MEQIHLVITQTQQSQSDQEMMKRIKLNPLTISETKMLTLMYERG